MRVLISGAGIAGLALALFLERAGHATTLVEKSPQLRAEGYMMDFFGPGYDVCERAGLLPALECIHYPIAKLSFVDADGGEQVSVPYADFRRMLRDRHYNFMRGDLERVLREELGDGADLRLGTVIESLNQDREGVTAASSDGTVERFDLVVGADGIHSHVRALELGAPYALRYLGYSAAAFIVDDPPDALAQMDAFATLTVPRRQVGVYPIRGGRVATLFMHEAAPEPPRGMPRAGRAMLEREYGDLGWIVPELLVRCPADDVYFDAVAQVEIERWSNGRVVLLGDACQCVSVIAGQGASLAIAGAYVLADELGRASTSSSASVEQALLRYEERLRPAVEQTQSSGRKLAKWFVPESGLRITARNWFLRAASWPAAGALFRRLASTESAVEL